MIKRNPRSGALKSWLRRVIGFLKNSAVWLFIRLDRTIAGTIRVMFAILNALWSSATFWNLVKGLPALAVILAAGALAANVRSFHVLGDVYLGRARLAVERKEFKQAELFFDRAVKIDGEKSEVLFEISNMAFAMGDEPRGRLLLNRIAPLKSSGYAPAHILQAKLFLANATNFDQLSLAETHLIHATSGRARYPVADGLLGQLYLKTNEPDKAVASLTRACDTNKEYLLMLARAYALAGDRQRAELLGQKAVDYYHGLSEASPTDIQFRLNWAEATTFLLRFEEAIRILQRGLALQADEVRIRKAMGEVYIAWFDELRKTSPDDHESQFSVMAAGIHANPGEAEFLQRAMMVIERDDPLAENARAIMRQMISSGKGAALAHLILGSDAIEQKDLQRAVKHLEMAVQLDPTMAVAANNLAWTLAFSDPPQLDRALALIDAVANHWPDFGPYRDTRGQILAKMERWEDALKDLQAALPQLSKERQLHETLAVVYEKLGLPEMAIEHRRLAENLPSAAGSK